LIRADSPSRSVGAAPAGHLASRPCQSDDEPENGFSAEDVTEFVARVRRFLSLAEDNPSR